MLPVFHLHMNIRRLTRHASVLLSGNLETTHRSSVLLLLVEIIHKHLKKKFSNLSMQNLAFGYLCNTFQTKMKLRCLKITTSKYVTKNFASASQYQKQNSLWSYGWPLGRSFNVPFVKGCLYICRMVWVRVVHLLHLFTLQPSLHQHQ